MTSPTGGLAAQFGMVDETTFGTSPTMTRFLEFNDEAINLTKERINSSGLRSGRRVLRNTQYVVGKTNVSGDVDFEVQQQGMGLLLKHCLGNVASSQPNVGSAPTAWEHKFTVGNLDGKSFSCQIGRGDVGGTVRAFTYAGCKIPKFDLSCSVDGLLMLKTTIDGISETTATALATASYAAQSFPLVWTGGTITLPGGATGNVKKFDLAGDNGQQLDRWFMGATPGTKKEQLESNLRSYSGSVDVEFTDLSLYNLFTAGTNASMTAFFTGPNIASIYNYALEITMPAVRFDGDTPNVPGPGLITTTFPYVAMDDGSATTAVQMVYRTTDTTP